MSAETTAPTRLRPVPEAVDGVLARAAALLDVFAASPEPALTVTVLSARSRLPLTTTHRLCTQLVREGLLARDGRSYRVGPHLLQLGARTPRPRGPGAVALPHLEDLHAVTGHHVQLVVLDGREAVVLERLGARRVPALAGGPGDRLPAHASSGGVAILAHGHAALLDELAAAPLAALTPQTMTTGRELRAAVAGVRAHGYAELRGAITPGLTSVAVPVRARGGAAIAAVSVITAAPATAGLLPALMTTALGVARALQR